MFKKIVKFFKIMSMRWQAASIELDAICFEDVIIEKDTLISKTNLLIKSDIEEMERLKDDTTRLAHDRIKQLRKNIQDSQGAISDWEKHIKSYRDGRDSLINRAKRIKENVKTIKANG